MNELLFEAYNVPSVNYGLDALYAAYANDIREDGLVISSGKNTTVVVPLVGGRGILDNSKRFVYVFVFDTACLGVVHWLMTISCACFS